MRPVAKSSKEFLMMFLINYSIYCFTNAYFIFGPFYEAFGASPHTAAMFLSIFYIAVTLFRPIGSSILEKMGVRRALVGGALASLLFSAGIALTLPYPPVPLIFRALSGMSCSVFIVAILAYQSMLFDEKSRGIKMALFTCGGMLPMATVVPLCDWLIKNRYTTAYLWLPSFILLLCLAMTLTVKENACVSKTKSWGSYADMFSVKGVKTLFVTTFIMSLADGSTLCVAALAMAQNVSVSCFMISASLTSIFMRTLGYGLIRKINRMFLAAPASVMMGAALFCLSFSSTNLSFYIFGTLFGVGIGIGFPTCLALIGDLLPVEFHPKATGCVLLATDLGWSVTPLIFGAMSPYLGANGVFCSLSIFVALISFFLFLNYWLSLYRQKHAVSKGTI